MSLFSARPSTPQQKLLLRYHLTLITASILIAIVAIIAVSWQVLKESEEESNLVMDLVHSRANEIETSLNSIIDRIREFHRLSQDLLESRDQLPPAPLHRYLGQKVKDKHFSTEFGEAAPDPHKTGLFHGLGIYKNFPEKLKIEANAALWMLPFIRVAVETTPQLAYLYIQGASFRYASIYPPITYEEVTKNFGDITGFSDAAYSASFWKQALPENNPERKPVWSDIYVDLAGADLFISYTIPIYVKETFFGIAAGDLGLRSLSRSLHTSPYAQGRFYLVNEKREILGPFDKPFDQSFTIDNLKDKLPEKLQLLDFSQLSPKKASVIKKHDYAIFSIPFKVAPWHLLYVVPEGALIHSIRAQLIMGLSWIVGILLLLLFAYRIFRSHYIQPAFQLIAHIDQQAKRPLTPTETEIPPLWKDWFHQVTEAFQSSWKNAERFRSLFENLPISVWEINASDVYKHLSELKAQGVTDLPAYLQENEHFSEMMAKTMIVRDVNQATCSLIAIEDKKAFLSQGGVFFKRFSEEAFRQILDALWRQSSQHYCDASAITKTGLRRHIALHWSIPQAHQHDFSRILITLNDITSRKEAEARVKRLNLELEARVKERTQDLQHANLALEEARDRAEGANRAKTVFLANMSHELRTPLNAVLGFAQLMTQDLEVTQRQKENLGVILRSGNHLLSLINDVLDMSKIEAGRMELDKGSCDLHQLLNDVKEMVLGRAEEKGLYFSLQWHEKLPRFVELDDRKLRQILINLLGNAIKYTEEGEVILRVQNVSSPPEEDLSAPFYCRFEVQDSGPGITVEDQKKIFEPFYQVGGSSNKNQGTGLGLSITRQFVALLGGRIQVKSEKNQGSCFFFDLPLNLSQNMTTSESMEKPIVIALKPGQPQYRFLVVDDNADNRLLLTRQLETVGFQIETASQGLEAIEKFQSLKPDLIWMDLRMPVMNGLEATKKIRTLEGGDKVVIVALTASAFREDQHHILSSGCQAMMPKPYALHEIFTLLEELLEIEFIYAEEAKATATPISIDLFSRSPEILPPEERETLLSATLELDMDRALQATEKIATHDQALAEQLKQQIKAFQFDKLLEWLESQ
ncbi:ATP-binding protein [Magnetococcales bacterium HHB-1]